MKSSRMLSFRCTSAVGLIALVLIFACLRILPSSSSLSSTSFLVAASEGEYTAKSFSSIQAAINHAENGSTIIVPSGIYYERIIINKTISLVGENVSTTIIDGSNQGTIIKVTADNVTIAGFTIQNSGWLWTKNGIYVYFADNCEIMNNFLFHNCHNIRLNYSDSSHVTGNTIKGDGYGIRLINSNNCTAIGNNVSDCIGGVHLQNATSCLIKGNHFTQNGQGIRLYSPCSYNKIIENEVYNNSYDGMIDVMPPNGTFFGNHIYHNNFINNTNPFIYKVSGTIWDDGYPSGGNYWSHYIGSDLYSGPFQNETGSDGIGDEPYAVNSFDRDRYPLMYPWGLLPVHNLNTGVSYTTIQEAIDANETLNGHRLHIDSGVYHEHVNVHKSLALIGENQTTTIIDGDNIGTTLIVSANNVSIVSFTIRNSGLLYPPYGDDCGVLLDHSSGGNVSHCIITDNRIGIYLFFAENNIVEHNIVSSNHENGIWLWYSGNNNLIANHMSGNAYNFGVFGGSLPDFKNTIDINNTVDGKSVLYLLGVEDEIIGDETQVGVLYLINSVNVTVRRLNLTKNGHGVFGYNVTNCTVEDVSTVNNNYGIYLQDSSHNMIENNHCSRDWVGICLEDSSYNIVNYNTARGCEKGISLYKADGNNLTGNTVLNNLYGIRLYSSNFNQFVHNNVVENTNQVDLISSNSNVWDNGLEGNYWSDYFGSDINRDGLGDDPRIIDSNSDHHPLLGFFSELHLEEDMVVTVISNSTILRFEVEALNHTIRLTVNSTVGTDGFCRLSIPYALIGEEISVIIDDGLTELLHENYSIRDDGVTRWIYFAYQHSTHDILIIPEFPSVFSIAFLIAAFCLSFSKMKTKNKHL